MLHAPDDIIADVAAQSYEQLDDALLVHEWLYNHSAPDSVVAAGQRLVERSCTVLNTIDRYSPVVST